MKFDDKRCDIPKMRTYVIGLVEKYSEDSNIKVFETSVEILEHVKDKINKMKLMEERKKRIDDMIEAEFEEIYWDEIRKLSVYHYFIDICGTYDKCDTKFTNSRFARCCNELRIYVNELKETDKRQENINKLIESTLDNKDWQTAKDHYQYRRYINEKNSDLEESFDLIKKHIDAENLREKQLIERKNKIDAILDKKYGKTVALQRLAELAKEHKKYKEYVYQDQWNKADTLENTVKTIEEEIDRKQNRKNRKSKLDYWISRNIPTELRSEAKTTLYKKFIENGDIDDIDQIKKAIKSRIDILIETRKNVKK